MNDLYIVFYFLFSFYEYSKYVVFIVCYDRKIHLSFVLLCCSCQKHICITVILSDCYLVVFFVILDYFNGS